MFFRKMVWLVFVSLTAIVLTACNIGATPAPTADVNAIYTAAAETAIAGFSAQMTQTALAVPPTAVPSFTPAPTNTLVAGFATPITPFANLLPGTGTPVVINSPSSFGSPVATLAGPVCLASQFIADVTIPDGTVVKPGQDFSKVWEIKNSGTCAWDDGFALIFFAGDNMDGPNILFKHTNQFVDPGESVQLTVDMTAHLAAGVYEGCWKMRDDKGGFFGTPVCYKIEVKK